MTRDINESGRGCESAAHQYIATVRLMHEMHIEPTAKNAGAVITWVSFDEGMLTRIAHDINEVVK